MCERLWILRLESRKNALLHIWQTFSFWDWSIDAAENDEEM